MGLLREGAYYVIEFSSIHNDDLEYATVICDTTEQVTTKIMEMKALHHTTHWGGEDLRYKVWKVLAKPVKVNEIQREYSIQIGEYV